MIGIYSEFYFYSSVVPSLLSAATGLMVLFSLLSSKVKLKNYTYYQAQLLIGASDLIRMTGYLLGEPDSDLPHDRCVVRVNLIYNTGVIQFYEYLFISGLLCYIIRFTSLPSRTTKALWIIILTFVSFLSCIFMAVFDIKNLFCSSSTTRDDYESGSFLAHKLSSPEFVAFILCYVLPIFLCNMTCLVSTTWSAFKLRYSFNSAMSKIIYRLLPYSLVMNVNCFVGFLFLVFAPSRNLLQATLICQCLSGTIIGGLFYLFFRIDTISRSKSTSSFTADRFISSVEYSSGPEVSTSSNVLSSSAHDRSDDDCSDHSSLSSILAYSDSDVWPKRFIGEFVHMVSQQVGDNTFPNQLEKFCSFSAGAGVDVDGANERSKLISGH